MHVGTMLAFVRVSTATEANPRHKPSTRCVFYTFIQNYSRNSNENSHTNLIKTYNLYILSLHQSRQKQISIYVYLQKVNDAR